MLKKSAPESRAAYSAATFHQHQLHKSASVSATSPRKTDAIHIMKSFSFIALASVALYNALAVLAAQLGTSAYTVPDALQAILTKNESAYHYPTDLTRNIVPKPLHSHNDYWRDVPFYSALSVGAVSVEADVWLINGTLHVGHEESALTASRTFDSLYIKPILSVLKNENPNTTFVPDGPTFNGVFDMDSAQTLYLFTDVKTDGPSTFKAVIQALEPLRAAGYLTSYNASTGVAPGPVTVIGTGNTPLDLVQGVSQRDYFFDAPLAELASTYTNITSDVSPIASTDFALSFGSMRTGFNATQLALLRQQLGNATAKGIGARYYDTPAFPTSLRNRVWSTLWEEGVMLINVDDLIAGAGLGGFGNFWEIGPNVV